MAAAIQISATKGANSGEVRNSQPWFQETVDLTDIRIRQFDALQQCLTREFDFQETRRNPWKWPPDQDLARDQERDDRRPARSRRE
jgi:Tfp pilus assembly protein PilP